MKWTYHARVERMGGRMADILTMDEVQAQLHKCKDELHPFGQTGVRVKELDEVLTLDGSTGNEVWAVVDEAERIVTVMLRNAGQRMNHQWSKEIR